MSNQSSAVIDNVLARMSDHLAPEQLTLLEASLIVSLRGMTVETECTELTPVVRDWEWFLSRFRANKRLKNCAESSISQYEYAIGKLREYVNKNPQEYEENDIKYFLSMYGSQVSPLTKRPPSKGYLNNLRNDLGSFFGWMHDEGLIAKDPTAGIPMIKAPKIMKKAYSGEDMERMKANARSVRDKAFIYFLDATGCRIGEALSVNRDMINWNNRTIIIYGTKGKAEREVIFTEEASYWLKEYLQQRTDEDPALFVKARAPHTRLTKTGGEHIIRELGKVAGVHAYPHRFRRTMITRCDRRGMSLQDIRALAGHANVSTTQIYIDMNKEAIRASYERCS